MAKGQIKQKQSKINQTTFESLCAIQCTEEEVTAVLNISRQTLNRWCNEVYGKNFGQVFAEKREFGKSSLRRMQWKQAEKNPTMAIWLGKQYLKQRDNVEVDHNMQNGIINDLIGALKEAK